MTDLEILKKAFNHIEIKYHIENDVFGIATHLTLGGYFMRENQDAAHDSKWNGCLGFEAYFAFDEQEKLKYYGATE